MASRGRSNFPARIKKFRARSDFDDEDEPMNGDYGPSETMDDGGRFGQALDSGDEEAQALSRRFAAIEEIHAQDEQMGIFNYAVGPSKMGWMLNMKESLVKDPEWPGGRSAVDYYFLEDDGGYFRSTAVFSPYFFIRCKTGTETLVEDFLRRKFENTIESMSRIDKEDLEMPNHLSGRKGRFLKLSFRNTIDLSTVRKVLLPAAQRNAELSRERGLHIDDFPMDSNGTGGSLRKTPDNYGLNNILELREYDLPHHLRVNIDLSIRCGLWYMVSASAGKVKIDGIKDKAVRPDPVVLAFDIETSKMPLKFPDAENDPIMMISYMIDGKGYLVNNRNIISKDLEDFEYTPKPEYQGKFVVYSESDERTMLLRFFSHIQLVRPAIYVTYNGDLFDWPYVERRCVILGIDMKEQCGIVRNAAGEYGSSFASHMDCYRWVKRDSYLPAGSQGLKAVTSAKLGYDPLELDPEHMTDLARTDPQTLANYSVSDAVATYYLYMKYVNPFIFSLCNIIPLTPDEVLRKGSGTLCETLLMAEAYVCNITMPNKHMDPKERFHNGHLIESETYIGGHVEALESGVFRSDIPCKFQMVPSALEQLIKDLDRALKFSLLKEGGVTDLSLVTNYDQVKGEIEGKLGEMLETPNRTESPLIYHLDVAAMYPNIILTNRLQPPAIVDESMCAMCDFNKPNKTCQRKMTWSWRGEFYTAKRSEYRMIKNLIESEKFPHPYNAKNVVPYLDLPENERYRLLKKRLAEYSQKVYKRTRNNEVVKKTSIVCQRENSFYVDTVRNFRDRRYDYKALHKQSKKKLDEAIASKNPAAIDEWSKMHTVYDSLQIAHKCILNSFYGYVMRKGARWYSMEMAGIVCETGGAIIRLARKLVEQIGRPLELDTDGIWCMLPATFPENFTFELSNGKKHSFAYPCVMLNHLVHDQFTNNQYQTLTDGTAKKYTVSSENSIFFEIDGPYRAMILPSSTEEGKLLKKRYAVFANDGKLAELKGFEIKRRGELKMIKLFQSQLFKTFLEGDSLVGCYASVARVADYWLDILHTKGAHLTDHELFELISENRSMSKSLEDYGEQKSTSISTARRLAEFLGDEMVKDKGLACKFIISLKPLGDPVASRAVPTAIFSAEPEVKRHYLRKWHRDPGMHDFDIRSILDWQYYLDRLESVIQKLILIPAAMQHVPNPVPRVPSPDWIRKFVERMSIGGSGVHVKKQLKMTDLFSKREATSPSILLDIEDLTPKKKSVKFDPNDPKVLKETELEKQPVEPAVHVDMNLNYSQWVMSQKAKWRQFRAQLLDPQLSTVPLSAFSDASSIWSKTKSQETLLNATWDVLNIEPHPDTRGLFYLYFVTNNPSASSSIRRVCFKQDRKIYVHCREAIDFPDSSSALPLVHYKLPYNPDGRYSTASSKIIYEVCAEEGDFMSNYQHYSNFLCHPNVVGIYEATIPLDFLNLIALGSRITIDPKSRSSCDPFDSKFVFSARDFVPDRIEGSSTSYLGTLLRYLFIFHLHTDNRHVFLLYCSRGAAIASVIIVDPAGKRQIPNLRNLFASSIESEKVANTVHEPFNLSIVPEFETDLVVDLSSAFRLIRTKLRTLLKARPDGPLVGLIDTTSGPLSPFHSLFTQPEDLHDPPIPLVSLSSLTEADSAFLPPLDWQRFGLKRGFEVLMSVNGWVRDIRGLARFAQIPLGNVATCPAATRYSFFSDVFLARELRQKGYLLPYASDDDLLLIRSSTESLQSSTQDVVELEFERSGVSENVAVDLNIVGFVLNCLLQYQSILGPEGAEAVILSTGGLYPILRSLIRAWFNHSFDETEDHGEHSLRLTANFYQWLLPDSSMAASKLISARSNVFSSLQLIVRRALGLMSGLTASLTTGMTPFLLTPTRLVISTRTRMSLENAQAFLEYFENQVTAREEFQFIQFIPNRFWKFLIWMDRVNYAGISTTTNSETDDSESSPRDLMEMNWLLVDYLPPIYEEAFLTVVQSFTETIFSQISSLSEDDDDYEIAAIEDSNENALEVIESGPSSFPKTFLPDPSENPIVEQEEDCTDKSSKSPRVRHLPFEFTQNFLLILQDLQKMTQSTALDERDRLLKQVPKSAQSSSDSVAGAAVSYLLEFIKYLGAVFGLHPTLALRAVPSLMKQAFALIGVREFSDATVYHSPIGRLKLKNLTCRQCGFVQTLDIAREQRFCCSDPACLEEFDAVDVEESLLAHLKSSLATYQRQDLICATCRLPTPSALSVCCPTCPNAAKLNLALSADLFKETKRVATQVAKTHRMFTVSHFITQVL